MAVQQPYSGAGLLPSSTLAPYGTEILKAGIGQLGTPINVGAMLPKVAGQTAFQQKARKDLPTCMAWVTFKEMPQDKSQDLREVQELLPTNLT